MWILTTDLILWLELAAAIVLFLLATCLRCAGCRLTQSTAIPNAERIARSGAINSNRKALK